MASTTHHNDTIRSAPDHPSVLQQQDNTTHHLDIEKAEALHVEENDDVDLKAQDKDQKLDYSGFAQKSDPKEIKLVRKLDIYIMVSSRLRRVSRSDRESRIDV
jgi:hypothetical protein